MKKLLTILLAVLLAATVIAGCANNDANTNDDLNTEVNPPVEDATPSEDEMPEVPEMPAEGEIPGEEMPEVSPLAQIVEDIYAIKAPVFDAPVMPVDITDADALKYHTGLDSAEKIKEAIISESMMGAIPYSLVIVQVKDMADTQAVAEEMKTGINTAKWVCVDADDLKVSGKDDIVVLIMISSMPDFAEYITPAQITEAFKEVCGGTLDFEL